MLAGGKTQVAYVPRPSQPKEDHYDITIYGDSSIVHGTTLGEVLSEDDSEAEAVMEAKQSGIVIDDTQFSVATVLLHANATALPPRSDAFGLPCFLREEAATKAMDLVTAALLGVEEAAGDDAAHEEDLGDDDDDGDDKQTTFAAALSGLSTKPKAATKKAPQAPKKPTAPTTLTRGASSASLNSTSKESHAGASNSAASGSVGVFPFVAAEDAEKRGRGSCSCRVDPRRPRKPLDIGLITQFKNDVSAKISEADALTATLLRDASVATKTQREQFDCKKQDIMNLTKDLSNLKKTAGKKLLEGEESLT
eukprot:3737887-Amphidinium_carterae.1